MSERRVALVTGATTGIGRAICLAFAKNGIDLAVNYRSRDEEAEAFEKELKTYGVDVIRVKTDISNYADSEIMVNTVINHFGKLNIVVNNAGITDDALLLRMTEAQFDQVIEINLKGVFNVCKHTAKHLLKATDARLINITSVAGIMGNIGQVNYSAAKAGVIGLTKTLAKEFASRNVTVNAVAPGFVLTKMTDKLPESLLEQVTKEVPLKRIGNPDDIATLVNFLASVEASYLTGQIIAVDGGLSI